MPPEDNLEGPREQPHIAPEVFTKLAGQLRQSSGIIVRPNNGPRTILSAPGWNAPTRPIEQSQKILQAYNVESQRNLLPWNDTLVRNMNNRFLDRARVIMHLPEGGQALEDELDALNRIQMHMAMAAYTQGLVDHLTKTAEDYAEAAKTIPAQYRNAALENQVKTMLEQFITIMPRFSLLQQLHQLEMSFETAVQQKTMLEALPNRNAEQQRELNEYIQAIGANPNRATFTGNMGQRIRQLREQLQKSHGNAITLPDFSGAPVRFSALDANTSNDTLFSQIRLMEEWLKGNFRRTHQITIPPAQPGGQAIAANPHIADAMLFEGVFRHREALGKEIASPTTEPQRILEAVAQDLNAAEHMRNYVATRLRLGSQFNALAATRGALFPLPALQQGQLPPLQPLDKQQKDKYEQQQFGEMGFTQMHADQQRVLETYTGSVAEAILHFQTSFRIVDGLMMTLDRAVGGLDRLALTGIGGVQMMNNFNLALFGGNFWLPALRDLGNMNAVPAKMLREQADRLRGIRKSLLDIKEEYEKKITDLRRNIAQHASQLRDAIGVMRSAQTRDAYLKAREECIRIVALVDRDYEDVIVFQEELDKRLSDTLHFHGVSAAAYRQANALETVRAIVFDLSLYAGLSALGGRGGITGTGGVLSRFRATRAVPSLANPTGMIRSILTSPIRALNAQTRPIVWAIDRLRGGNGPVGQIMRIARNGSLTLEQQTARIVEILNQPTLTIAQRQQILEELIRRGVNVNGSPRQSLAINAVLRGGNAMSDVERGRIALAILRANGGTQLTEEALRGMVSAAHLFQQAQLEAAYKTLADAHTALSATRNATTITNVQSAERAVVNILRAKTNKLVQLGLSTEQANLLVRSAVCGSEGAVIAQNVARMPGVTVSQEMQALLGVHVPPAARASFFAPRAGAGLRLLKGAPFLALDAFLTYQSYVELDQERKERDETVKQVTAVLRGLGFRQSGDVFRLQAPGSRSSGIELRMTDLLAARDARLDTRVLNAGVQTGGLLIGAAAMAYGGPVGIIVGVGAAAIVVSVNVYGEVKDFEKAYALLANRRDCPSWLFWLLGGAKSLTGKTGMELLEGPGFLASFFASEATPAAKERMLFCAVIEKLSPEDRMELMEAVNIGRTNQIEALDSLYEAFPVAKDFFAAQLFARYPDPISWDDARNLKIPSRPWIFDGPHANALFGSIRATSHMFAAHVLEQNYLRSLALSQQRPDDAALAQQVRMLGRHRVFGATLAERQAELLRNQPQGQETRTRAFMISQQVREHIVKVAGAGGNRSALVNQQSLAAAMKEYRSSLARAQANGDKEFPLEPRDRDHLRQIPLSGINGMALLESQNFQLVGNHADLWSGDHVLSLAPQNNPYALAEWAIDGQRVVAGGVPSLSPSATSTEAEHIFNEISRKTALDTVSTTPHALMGYLPPPDAFSRQVPVFSNVQALPFSFLRQGAIANLAATPHMSRPESLHFTAIGHFGAAQVIVQTLGYKDFGNARKSKQRVLLVAKDSQGQDAVVRSFEWSDVPPTNTHSGIAAMRIEGDEAIESAVTRYRNAGRDFLRAEGAQETPNGELALRGKVFRYVPGAQRWEWRDDSETNFTPVTAAAAPSDPAARELHTIASTLQALNGGSINAAEMAGHVRSMGEELLRANGAMPFNENGLATFILQQPPDPYRMQFRWREGKWEVRTNTNAWERLNAPQNFAALNHASSFGRWLRLRNALARANSGDVSGMSEVQGQLVDEHEELVAEYLRSALGAREQTMEGEKRYLVDIVHPSGTRALVFRCDDGEWQVQEGNEWIPTEDHPPFMLAGVLPQHRQRIERLNAALPALNASTVLAISSMTAAARGTDRANDRALTQKIAGEYVVQGQQKEAGGFMSNAQMLYAVAEGTFNNGATDCLIRLRPDAPGQVAPLAYCLPDGRVLLLRRNNAGGLDRRILPNLQALGIVNPGAPSITAQETTKAMEQRGKQMLDVLSKTEAQDGWVSLDTPVGGDAEAQKQFQEQVMRILALPVRDIGHDLETNVIANVEQVFHALHARSLLDPTLNLTPNIGDPNAGDLPVSQPVDMVVRAYNQYVAHNPGATIDAFIAEVNTHIEAERDREEKKLVNLSVVSRAAHNVELGRAPRPIGQ